MARWYVGSGCPCRPRRLRADRGGATRPSGPGRGGMTTRAPRTTGSSAAAHATVSGWPRGPDGQSSGRTSPDFLPGRPRRSLDRTEWAVHAVRGTPDGTHTQRSTDALMTLSPGLRFGSFEILGLLGAGGMGEVYRARDSRLSREVALKTLPADLARSPDFRFRFEREGRFLAALNHPHVAAIYGL